MSARKSKPAPSLIDLSTDVRAVLDELAPGAHVDLGVEHEATTYYMRFGAHEGEGLKHRLRAVIPYYHLHRASPMDPPDLTTVLAPYAIRHNPDILNDERLVVAQLEIEEYPAHFYERQDWRYITDVDSEGDELGNMLDELIDEDRDYTDGFSLNEGAFLWPRTLAVHPKLRGQGLGVRLLAHGLWALHRSVGDVAGFAVGRIQSCFDTKRWTWNGRGGKSRMFRYYGQIGFRRWKRTDLVYLILGERGIRVNGLGGLSNPDAAG